jgi:hypothetical protein
VLAQPYEAEMRIQVGLPFLPNNEVSPDSTPLRRSKYVDSHIRPYRCRIMDSPDCRDAKFSSNACLLRHEREAHGDHNHGLNPYLCIFPSCERAKAPNGFPRAWNRRDHMMRVHGYEDERDISKKRTTAHGQSKRRKATSVPMQRSGSSAVSKVQAMSNVSVPIPVYAPTDRTQYVAHPSTYSMMPRAPMMTQYASMADVQFAQPQPMAISRTSGPIQPYHGMYSM